MERGKLMFCMVMWKVGGFWETYIEEIREERRVKREEIEELC